MTKITGNLALSVKIYQLMCKRLISWIECEGNMWFDLTFWLFSTVAFPRCGRGLIDPPFLLFSSVRFQTCGGGLIVPPLRGKSCLPSSDCKVGLMDCGMGALGRLRNISRGRFWAINPGFWSRVPEAPTGPGGIKYEKVWVGRFIWKVGHLTARIQGWPKFNWTEWFLRVMALKRQVCFAF